VRFLGVDLAWKDGNRSGVALLGGQRFPLHLREVPHTLPRHGGVLDWIARHVAHHRASVGIDAPLLGLGGGRRGGDNEVSSAFGRFHASTHSPPRYPGLDAFTRALLAGYALECRDPAILVARCERLGLAPRKLRENLYAVSLPEALGGAWIFGTRQGLGLPT